MAEREEKNSLKADEPAEHEEDDSSVSEYEEIIEEVTDYSDAEEAEFEQKPAEVKQVTASTKEVTTKVKTTEQVKEVVKESRTALQSTERTEVDATTSKDGAAASSVAKTTVVAAAASAAAASVKETAATSAQSAPAAVPASTSAAQAGESLMPLLQNLLHKSMPQARTANQNSNTSGSHRTATASANKTVTNRTSVAGHGAANSSSESSLTVNNNTKSIANTHTHTNKSTTTKSTVDTTGAATATATATMTATGTTANKDDKMQTSVGTTGVKQVDRLSVPHKEDSGTESGEDLRLLAAGLRDKLDMQGDTNLIEEVTAALSRLESSLKEGGKDIPVDSNKRNSLLALVARLQTGLTSPEKLAEVANAVCEMEAQDANFEETSSPEADAHRSNRQRFAKRRNRITRHTVGVSREELADARRYMEDMLIMDSISNCTTPDSSVTPVTPPQLFPLEKNASSTAVLTGQPSTLYRPNQFVPSNIKSSTECLDAAQQGMMNMDSRKNKRPISGEYSVSFEPSVKTNYSNQLQQHIADATLDNNRTSENASPDNGFKGNRFTSKKQLMKRANTIDIPKTKKYNPDVDTDSDAEDRGPGFGLKRTVQVSVKQRGRHVVPAFEPKTENDHKFLAFINKQSVKSGLGWNSSRSVSNWTNKFGNLKHAFEVGAAATSTTGKPPPAPGHVSQNVAKTYWNKQLQQHPQPDYIDEQLQRSQYEAAERQRRLERERLEYVERDRMARQHFEQEREQLERARYEKECYEAEMLKRQQMAAAAAAAPQTAMPPKQEAQPLPVNQFIHAPQSVFRPIDSNDFPAQPIFKPIPQLPTKTNTWQPPSMTGNKSAPVTYNTSSPQFLTPKQQSYVTSSSPTATSPIGLPWTSKPTANNSDFKHKARHFEERSQNDNRNNASLQRYNSLRAPRVNHQDTDDYQKRPSLPNTTDPFMAMPNQVGPAPAYVPAPMIDRYAPPPPTNISFTYADYNPRGNYQSYPCLPTAVDMSPSYTRSRGDSLTNPDAMPLVLTSANPSYNPQMDAQPQSAQSQKRFDYVHPLDSAPTSPSLLAVGQADYTDDDLDSDNMTEYRAEIKVMRKPQSQTAVTVGRRTGHVSDDEVFGKNSRAARSLLHTMKHIGGAQNGQRAPQKHAQPKPEPSASPVVCLSPDGRPYQAPMVEPLFPQITNFEIDRTPKYTKPSQDKSSAPQYKTARGYNGAPVPDYKQQTQYAEQDMRYYAPAPVPAPAQQLQPATNAAPYVSETQTAYVVTYPTEEPLDAGDANHSRQPPTTLPLQRSRNYSENSTASSSVSASFNLPSPNTNWTPNPIHGEDATKKNYSRPEEFNNNAKPKYQQPTQQQQQYSVKDTQVVQQKIKSQAKVSKPHVAPKPHLPLTALKNEEIVAPQYQLPSPQQQIPPQQNVVPPQRQTQFSQKQLPQQQQPTAAPKQTKSVPKQSPPQPQSPVYQPSAQPVQRAQKPTAATHPKLATRSQTISSSSQSFEQQQQPPKLSLYRQKTVDADMSPLQLQNRVLSQQSLVTKQQQQQITELRRKSQGNALDVQQRKTAYFEAHDEIKQEYKSSAPADTPDIVKSSLPKEDMPILKKYGPPQRHHYMPNAYQSPNLSNTKSTTTSSSTSQTKRFASTSTASSNTKTIKTTIKSAKPAIVEIPATPQPEEDLIPRNIVFNNVSAFTSMSQRHVEDHAMNGPARPNRLSKSDSWNQIVKLQNQSAPQPTSPKFNTSGNELRRTKSGHSLAMPKLFEAGINKAEVGEKQRTVEAYFAGKKSPSHTVTEEKLSETQIIARKSAINRTKTSEKVSASRKSLSSMTATSSSSSNSGGSGGYPLGGGLSRSATMPHIANLNLLDESNVEDAFEQLMLGS